MSSSVQGEIDEGERSLDPNSVRAQRVVWGIFTAVVATVTSIGLIPIVFFSDFGVAGLGLLAAAWVFFISFIAAFGFWWPAVRYRHTSYRLSDRGIRIRRGVVWRSVVTIPRTRVQHTDVSQGPVERAFDLGTLIIYTAGTQHASVHLGGLSLQVAQRVRDYLIEAGDRDAV